MVDEACLEFYAAPGVFTDVGAFADEVAALRQDAGALASVVQGLIIHEALAPMFGVALMPERAAEKQIHTASAMLAAVLRIDSKPLASARPASSRLVGVCRHFATLFAALMRAKGIPCRARCGFATYFESGKKVDHWVGEYWNAALSRWTLVDVQVGPRQRDFMKLDFDTLDVPRDRFLVAGDAWKACRSGAEDPMTFGVSGTENWGLIEVYGDLFQDLAALQKIELLPWSWYGLALDKRGVQDTDLIDMLASLSSRADGAALETLATMQSVNPHLRVPPETIAGILKSERAKAEALGAPTPRPATEA